jgi:trigger factor
MTTQDEDHTQESQVDESSVATAEDSAEETPKRKLDLTVEINDAGPCKRHVSITIPRAEVDRQFKDSLAEVRKDAALPGFRPGRAPATLVQKRYRKELGGQVKSSLLLAAMQQLDEDYKLNAIVQPNLDLDAVEMPDDGPMTFQFDLEVEPEFELPKYDALELNRPIKTVNSADIDAQLKSFLERYAQMVPKEGGTAELGDYVTADLTFHKDGVIFNQAKELQFRLLSELRFQDGHVPELAKALVGAKPGDVREAHASVGSASADAALRGQEINISFHVHDLKRLRLPELDQAFFDKLGFADEAELREGLEAVLRRRIAFSQRQALRRQVLDHLIQLAPFELPADLVARQEEATLRGKVDEMRQAGLSDNDLRARRAEIRANVHEQTKRSLKEYFLLAKIAEGEKIEVTETDLEDEIESIAERSDESPRRVRARVRNEGLTDALSQQILERKTLDRVLELATIKDVEMTNEREVETLDELASPVSEGTSEADANEGSSEPRDE